MLSPNKKIQDHVKANPDPEDKRAIERLLKKLHVPSSSASREEPKKKEAEVIDKFFEELSDFQHHQGVFDREHIWYMVYGRFSGRLSVAREVLIG